MNEDVNVLRNDDMSGDYTQKQALHNAPDSDSDYIRVPKVLKRKQ
jgi:aspartyl/glutamyl-tRNA(Asn/Gln) amidotransferase C subunit